MSDDQTKTTDEGRFAVCRVGRMAAPVFRESLEDAIRTAKAGAEQSGGEYRIFRVLGSVRAEAHWTARAGTRQPDRVVSVTREQLDDMVWPFCAILENIKTRRGQTERKPNPEPERDAEKIGPKVNPACWTRDP